MNDVLNIAARLITLVLIVVKLFVYKNTRINLNKVVLEQH